MLLLFVHCHRIKWAQPPWSRAETESPRIELDGLALRVLGLLIRAGGLILAAQTAAWILAGGDAPLS